MSRQGGAELQRVQSYTWPAAHVGHLNSDQQGALDRFKQLCEQKQYYAPASEDGQTPATHDDETLLRYLRARKFIPQEAFQQFKDTEDWRKETRLDELYETIDVDEYEQTRRLYPQWTGRRDKRGIPFYVYEVNHVSAKDVSAQNSEKGHKKSSSATSVSATSKTPLKMLRLFALYENLVSFVLPWCSAIPSRSHSESPISQSSNLVDLSHVGLTKFWGLRNHMSDASTLATAHYPETLDRIFVVGAPSFFPTVWEWAKKWFDPITVSKIFILTDKNMKSTLEKYIDLDNLPKKYGGNLNWEFGDMPFLEPQIANSIRWEKTTTQKGHTTLPIGPIKWHYDKDGDLVASAVGTESGKPRNQILASLHPETHVARLALSPGRASVTKHSSFTSASGAAPVKSPATVNGTSTLTPSTTTKVDMASSEYADLNTGKSADAAVQGSSRAGTYTVPYRDHDNDIASPPSDSRQGTSSTRYEQQASTHARGEMAHGTPETRIDSQGEKLGVMEPNTIGQAPKEHPMPKPEDEEAQPGLVEQAKGYAGQAYEQASQLPSTVMAAVGMGGKQEEQQPTREETQRRDPAVDNMEGRNVEEFLRSKTMSGAEPMERR